MKLPFHPAARAELRAAVAYLSDQHAELGDEFLRLVATRVRLAQLLPGTGRVLEEFPAHLDVRQHLIRRFGYVVVTAILDGTRAVIAIAHTRRRPLYWAERLP